MMFALPFLVLAKSHTLYQVYQIEPELAWLGNIKAHD
jgi:hypothetical protein